MKVWVLVSQASRPRGQARRTSPGKDYALNALGRGKTDTAGFSGLQAQLLERQCKLLGRLELNTPDAKPLCRLYIGCNVVDVYSLLCSNPASPQRLPVNQGIRLCCPYCAGINADWKMGEKIVARLHVRHMYRVSVGQQR